MPKKDIYSLGSWVQNCHSFSNLRKVIEIFVPGSNNHSYLSLTKIPKIVSDISVQNELLLFLNNPSNIPLYVLKGTSFTPRSSAQCNGLVQAAIDGQRRLFVDDWTAINFIKWAVICNFLDYDEDKQLFNITQLGRNLVATEIDSSEEKEFFKKGLSTYPPIFRILSLLDKNLTTPLTKFDLGKNLGFTNEVGFTSYPFEILIQSFDGLSKKERNKLKTDCEGTSDKYARGICSWLLELQLIIKKTILIKNVKIDGYSIHANGKKFLNQIIGNSSNKKITKNLSLTMLGGGVKGDKDKNTDYIRNRRGNLLNNVLSTMNSPLSIQEICKNLTNYGINENETVILNDLKGLINIGINIQEVNDKYYFNDDIILPSILNRQVVKHKDIIQDRHDKILSLVSDPIKKFSQLILLAHEGKNNKLFESKVMDLLLKTAQFEGKYLGGASRPDGIIIFPYQNNQGEVKRLGVLLDQKAYENGYNVPIGQSDAMSRYIEEYQRKDPLLNKNLWWQEFKCDEIAFCFISGEFNGSFNNKIQRISHGRGVNGAVITIDNLLLLCDKKINNHLSATEMALLFQSGKEIILP